MRVIVLSAEDVRGMRRAERRLNWTAGVLGLLATLLVLAMLALWVWAEGWVRVG